YDSPEVITGWNCEFYDIPYIYGRLQKVLGTKVAKKISPWGIVTEDDLQGFDRFKVLKDVMNSKVLCLEDKMSLNEMYHYLTSNRLSVAPVVNKKGVLIGIMTPKACLRSEIYKPNLDKNGKLKVAVAIGVNKDVEKRAKALIEYGVEILVLDTAHGHQQKMIDAIKLVRKLSSKVTIVAGNIATKEGTRDLLMAGADIIKVGIGPGAMCTTRVMTGVGRPQLSAVMDCAKEARKLGKHIWADGGIRYPRDIALAMAGGAGNVMFASWFAKTNESAGEIRFDESGRAYKESFGMASRRAVRERNQKELSLDLAKKELFEEGISTSKFYIDPSRPGVEDIIDQIMAGVRSSCTYVGVNKLDKMYSKAVIGLQSSSGYQEGLPTSTNW
ncbi:MAG: CBS domain-containing protein, partial [Chitinophagia bacterium]|nr:CBS domain-containing protein [Chitinophagia bacterium]